MTNRTPSIMSNMRKSSDLTFSENINKYKQFIERESKIIGETHSKNNHVENNMKHFILFHSQIDEITSDSVFIEEIIISLKKSSSKRVVQDFKNLFVFLNRSKFAEKFRNEKLSIILFNIISFCSFFIEYQFLKNEKTLFRQGDKGDKFYIIVQGKVKICKHSSKELELNAHEYFNLLRKMELNEEFDLLNKTIQSNKEIYPFNQNDLDRFSIEEIFFRYSILKSVKSQIDVNDLSNIFNKFSRVPSKYGLNLISIEYEQSNAKNKSVFNHQQYEIFLKIFSSGFNHEGYDYISNFSHSKVKVYEYLPFLTLENGDYFGDYAFDLNHKERTATIIASEDCHLGFINHEIYNKYIYEEKIKIWENEVNFFVSSFFFQNIKKLSFKELYYNYFIYLQAKSKEIIWKEGSSTEHLLFFREGVIELTMEMNIVELIKTIKILSSNIQEPEEEYILNSNMLDVENLMKIKQKIKIYNVSSPLEIGLIEFINEFNHIYSVKVISNHAIYYKLSCGDLKTILNLEPKIKGLMHQKQKKILKSLYWRLIEVRNSLLHKLENEDLMIKKNKRSFSLNQEALEKLNPQTKKNSLNYSLALINPDYYNKIVDKSKFQYMKRAPILPENLVIQEKNNNNKFETNLNNLSGNEIELSVVNNDETAFERTIFKKKIQKKEINRELKNLKDYYAKTKLLPNMCKYREDTVNVKIKQNKELTFRNQFLPYIFSNNARLIKKSKNASMNQKNNQTEKIIEI